MISSAITRVSAGCLLLGGVVLLFASDAVLPRFVPGFRPADAWFGQLLAAAWLALAVLNWFNRSVLLGGIYGRPVVMTNAVLYFVGAMALLKVLAARETPSSLWAIAVPVAFLAIAYGWLLFRGPLAHDVAIHSR